MRTSYVFVNGELYEKAGDNTIIVAGEKWYNLGGKWGPLGQAHGIAPMVMPDIDPYCSVIDGSLITSRSRHREHLRDHGCIEIGNERPKPKQVPWTATQGLRDELIARYNQ